MKRRSISGLLISIGIAVLAYYYFHAWGEVDTATSETSSYDIPTDDTAFGGYFHTPYINDSLPHYAYQKIADSIQQQKNKRDLINNGSFSLGMSYGFLGVNKIEKPELNNKGEQLWDSLQKKYTDSSMQMKTRILHTDNKDSIRFYRQKSEEYLDKLNTEGNKARNQAYKDEAGYDYYFGLSGYSLDPDMHFYIHNGENYLLYPVVDTVEQGLHEKHSKGHYESMPLTIRYAANQKQILFPVSAATYQVLTVALNVLSFMMLLGVIYFCLVIPVHIVWNISRGRVFEPYNYRMLKLTGLVLFFTTLISGFLPYIIRWFLGNRVPPQFKMEPLLGSFFGDIPGYFLAVFVFAIGLAFQRGAALQDLKEQENTDVAQ